MQEFCIGNEREIRTSSDNVAIVDHNYYWQPIETCPEGHKVQLLSKLGCAVYGIYRKRDTFWVMWAPLPKIPREV